MEDHDTLTATLWNAADALGRGFDVAADHRLLYCKGTAGSRLVAGGGGGAAKKDFVVGESVVLRGLLWDVDVDLCDGRPDRIRPENGTGTGAGTGPFVCSFQKMAEYFNRKSGLAGSIPLGSFNSMFTFTGCWKNDAAATKALAMDGYSVPLYKASLVNPELALNADVIRAVPASWDPLSLASFIENYGTHIITSVTIGGKDEVYIKQHSSSQLSQSEFENYTREISDQRFRSSENQNQPTNFKDKDITVIFRRRGGCDLVQNHEEWTRTIRFAPDIISMTFIPIISLLEGLPGKKHLSRAIDLYLEYKPPIEELHYFLDFQIQRVWAPLPNSIPGQRKEPVCPFLQFSLMGPKLYISPEQISVGRKPITGLRLSLEGPKQNRLAIHLQHLSALPKILLPHWDSAIPIGPPKWHGPEEQDSRWFEPIKWKNFAHVSTAPIEMQDSAIGEDLALVTGAQLGVWDFGVKSVLFLKLLFSRVPGCTVRRSVWDHSPGFGESELVSGSGSGSGSGSESNKLVRIVDGREMMKGAGDSPGHWVVTGGKLGVEKGRIVLRVKYSLLNY
ncbi:hypothetical protein LUZ60_008437 [Juncus effusus]|nr:hypothetical protein LUZ60_008437 [Juncus effusus]